MLIPLNIPLLQAFNPTDYAGNWLAVVIAVVIALAAIGAMFAASNTMYSV